MQLKCPLVHRQKQNWAQSAVNHPKALKSAEMNRTNDRKTSMKKVWLERDSEMGINPKILPMQMSLGHDSNEFQAMIRRAMTTYRMIA